MIWGTFRIERKGWFKRILCDIGRHITRRYVGVMITETVSHVNMVRISTKKILHLSVKRDAVFFSIQITIFIHLRIEMPYIPAGGYAC